MDSSPFLTDSRGGIGFSSTDLISEFFFTFCLPIILFIFLLKVYHDSRQRKKRLRRIIQNMPGKDDFTDVKDSEGNSDSDVSIIWLILVYGPLLWGVVIFALEFFS